MSMELLMQWSRILGQLQSGDWIIPPNPILLIHCGTPCRDEIRRVIAEQSNDTIILYVFPGPIYQEQEVLQIAGRCNFLPISTQPDGVPDDRIAMASELLLCRDCQFSMNHALSEQFVELFQTLPEKLMQAQFVRKNQTNTRLSRLDAMIGNLALSASRRVLRLIPGNKPFPSVICGAGPSLESSIPLLHRYRQKIFILAVGHAFNTLMQNGVRPDAIAEIDPNARKNWHHGISPGEIPLIGGIGVDPWVAAKFRNLVWGICWEKHEFQWFHEAKVPLLPLAGGRSVIIPALDFARLARFSAIATVGTDMCFSASGQAHASEPEKPLEEIRFPVPGWDGGTVETNELLNTIRKAVEKYLQETPWDESFPLYNCTTRGAVVAGMKRLEFGAWLEQYTKMPTVNIFDSSVKSSSLAISWLRQEAGMLKKQLKNANDIVRLTRQHLAQPEAPQMTQLPKLLAAEKAFPSHLFYVLNNIRHRVDELMLSEVLPIKNPPLGPNDEWQNLELRYHIQEELSADLWNKITIGAGLNNSPKEEKDFLDNLYAHRAFVWLASLVVRRSHPAFADYLLKSPSEGHPAFRFTYKWHEIESVIRRDEGQGELILDPPISYSDAVKTEAPSILATMKLADTDGIVFLAPCGWQYVFAFLHENPHRPMLILEPFPALFRQLIDYSLFPVRMPATSALIGIDHQIFPDASTILQEHLANWQQHGIHPRLLVHPRAGGMPELHPVLDWLQTILQ